MASVTEVRESVKGFVMKLLDRDWRRSKRLVMVNYKLNKKGT